MELTSSEQKILKASIKFNEHNQNKASKLNLAFLLVGVTGGSILVIYGFIGLFYNKTDALRSISFGLLLIGFLAMMYENLRFRSAALSLIRKLTNEQKEIQSP